VWARELGSPVDSVLHVRKADGAALSGNDDRFSTDSYIRWGVPEDGTYTISVKDHLDRGGDDFAYRVEITPIRPEVRLRVENNVRASVVVPRGNQTLALVRASKADFGDSLALHFGALPEGLTVHEQDFGSGDAIIPVLFAAAGDAPVGGSLVSFIGTPPGESPAFRGRFDQVVDLVTGQNQVLFEGHNVRDLAVAVTEPAPFNIRVREPQHGIPVEGTSSIIVEAERAEGFTAPIDLDLPWSPPGMNAPAATIAEGHTETVFGLGATGGASTGPRRIMVRGRSSGWDVATPIIEIPVVEPWVSFEMPTLETELGQSAEFVIPVTVNKPFEGEHQVIVRGLPRGVATEDQMLTAEATELRFPLTIAEDAPVGEFKIDMRAHLVLDGETLTHGEAGGVVKIHKPAPPALQAVQEAPAKEEEKKPEETKRKTRFPSAK